MASQFGTGGSTAAPRAFSTAEQPLVGTSSNFGGTNYRLSNGETLGPRRSMFGASASTRATQGMVTTNVAVNPNLYTLRARITEKIDSSLRIGSVQTPSDLYVDQHELMFTSKGPGGRGGSATSGFTSFNGMNVSPFATQDDFEDNLRCLGRAKIPYYFESDEQQNNGVSVQMRGAYSTTNRGKHTFSAGDRVAWAAPSIFKAQRAAEAKEIHMPEEMDHRKEMATLVPVSYAYVHKLPQRAYARYMQEALAPNGDEKLRTRQGDAARATRHADRLTRYAITYLRAGGMLKLYAGLCVLVEKGLVTLTLGAELNSATYPRAVARANEKLSDVESAVAAPQAEQLAALAHMLDLVDGRPRDTWLVPASALIGDIVEVQARGLAAKTSREYSRLPLSRFVRAAPQLGPVFAPGGPLDRMQLSALRREVASFAETKRREDEKVLGVALNTAYPGEMLDVCS